MAMEVIVGDPITLILAGAGPIMRGAAGLITIRCGVFLIFLDGEITILR
jgi:hypothetical protein